MLTIAGGQPTKVRFLFADDTALVTFVPVVVAAYVLLGLFFAQPTT